MLLFGDETKYNVLKSADDLIKSIKNGLKEREAISKEEKKKIYVKQIKDMREIIDRLIKSEKKYYEFYKKHTYQFGEDVSIIDNKDCYIECKRCGFREKF